MSLMHLKSPILVPASTEANPEEGMSKEQYTRYLFYPGKQVELEEWTYFCSNEGLEPWIGTDQPTIEALLEQVQQKEGLSEEIKSYLAEWLLRISTYDNSFDFRIFQYNFQRMQLLFYSDSKMDQVYSPTTMAVNDYSKQNLIVRNSLSSKQLQVTLEHEWLHMTDSFFATVQQKKYCKVFSYCYLNLGVGMNECLNSYLHRKIRTKQMDYPKLACTGELLALLFGEETLLHMKQQETIFMLSSYFLPLQPDKKQLIEFYENLDVIQACPRANTKFFEMDVLNYLTSCLLGKLALLKQEKQDSLYLEEQLARYTAILTTYCTTFDPSCYLRKVELQVQEWKKAKKKVFFFQNDKQKSRV